MRRLILSLAILLLALNPPVSAAEVWNTYQNMNDVRDMAFDGEHIWMVIGGGSVIKWDKKQENFTNYSYSAAMAIPPIMKIIMDSKGRIWITSGNGVSCFDGTGWKAYTAVSEIKMGYVSSIAEDKTGTIWIGAQSKLFSYADTLWKVYAYQEYPFLSGYLYVAVAENNVKWIGTSERLYSYDGKKFTGHAMINSDEFAVDLDNVVWICPSVGGLSTLSGSTLQKRRDAPEEMGAVTVGKDNTKWFIPSTYYYPSVDYDRTHPGGVYSFNGLGWNQYTKQDGLSEKFIKTIKIDDTGAVWAASSNGFFNFVGTRWNAYKIVENCIASNEVLAITEDSNGAIWFSTKSGVSRLENGVWKNFTTDDGLPIGEKYSVILGGDNTVWVGSCTRAKIVDDSSPLVGGGLSRYDNGKWTTFFPDTDIQALSYDREGMLWTVYFKPHLFAFEYTKQLFIATFQNQTWNTITIPKNISQDFLSVAVDKNNVKWFGAQIYNGVYEGIVYSYDDSGFHIYPDRDIAYLLSRGICDTIWFISKDGKKLTSYDGSEWKTYISPYGMGKNSLVTEDKLGVFWFKTGDGLASFDGKTWKLYASSNTISFLYPNQMNALMIDKNNRKWICTNQGIAVLSDEPNAVQEHMDYPAIFEVKAFPNPFNPSTTISYTLPSSGRVSLAIYDITGRKVRTLVDETLPAGTHQAIWNGTDERGTAVASGIYFARIVCGSLTATAKMLLIK